MLTALPAYGRQYANANAAKLDWHTGKDFLESSSRRAFSKSEEPGEVLIRYGKGLTKIAHYTSADKRKLDKQIAADRATRPQFGDFDAWMVTLDKAIISETGMSYKDLPDWDFRTAFDDGVDPVVAAGLVMVGAFE